MGGHSSVAFAKKVHWVGLTFLPRRFLTYSSVMVTLACPSCSRAAKIPPASAVSVPAFTLKSLNWNSYFSTPASYLASTTRDLSALAESGSPHSFTIKVIDSKFGILMCARLVMICLIAVSSSPVTSIRIFFEFLFFHEELSITNILNAVLQNVCQSLAGGRPTPWLREAGRFGGPFSFRTCFNSIGCLMG